MSDIAVTVANVRPLPDAVFRQMPAGEALSLGAPVYVKNDSKAWRADASALASAFAIGIVVAVGTFGATAAVAGDMVSIQMSGPIAGFTITAGARAFVSDTVGRLADAAGTIEVPVGIGLGDNILWLNPTLYSPDTDASV